MTKQEYFDELRRKLRDYPEEYAELREAFEEHFEEGRKNGQSEEEIIEELGTVDEMIENLGLPKHRADIRNDFEDLGNAFGSFLNSLGDTIEEGMRSLDLETRLKDFSERIADVTETAVNEATRPQSGYVGGPIRRIEVWGNAMDLNLSASKDSDVHYEYSPGLTVFAKSINELKITNELDNVVFRESSPSGALVRSSSTLDLKIPEGVAIEFHSKSGDLRAENITLEQLEAKTLSGDHKLTDISCGSIRIDSVSGDMELKRVSYRDLHIKTVSGDYDLDGCSGSTSIETVSGDIEIDSLQGENVFLKSTSGDIDISCICDRFQSSALSGDQKIRFIDLVNNAEISAKTGDIDLETELDNCRVDAKTSTGDIRFPRAAEAVRYDDHHFLVGIGSSEIFAKTFSGDIHIH